MFKVIQLFLNLYFETYLSVRLKAPKMWFEYLHYFFKLNFWRVFAIWPNCALCVLGCIIRKISYFIFHHQENWCDFISEHVGVCCCCQPFSCHGYNVKTLRKLIKEPWMTWQKRWFIVLKVSRSRNKIVEPQILPKNEWTNLFFYPEQ